MLEDPSEHKMMCSQQGRFRSNSYTCTHPMCHFDLQRTLHRDNVQHTMHVCIHMCTHMHAQQAHARVLSEHKRLSSASSNCRVLRREIIEGTSDPRVWR